MAVLAQPVVLAKPHVLPVVLVGQDATLGFPHEFGVLALGVVGGGTGDIAVRENAELHGSLLADR